MPCYTLAYRTEIDLSIDVEAPDRDTAVAIADGRVRIELPGLLRRAGPVEALRTPEPTARQDVPIDPDTAPTPPRRLGAVR